MRQLTEDEAIAFAETGAWRYMGDRGRACFQIEQNRLCMPWEVFRGSVDKALGRSVPTIDFHLGLDRIKAQLRASLPSFSKGLDRGSIQAQTMGKLLAVVGASADQATWSLDNMHRAMETL